MMIEPRSTATIRALASLAELSADQLEDGVSIEEVITTLRKAAEAVRMVIDTDEECDEDASEIDLVQDLTPMDLSGEEADAEDTAEEDDSEEVVLNAG
ncbi:hypothetical protein [Roseibium sp. MMSF_3544]|uniref:hypothetical protein n=1 Tax=unclassified Roseibium TaxID=2629323 RepID=UPI00273FD8A7|nr:hypothetical protein [Roseibium sp. MMSF_3544]